ncbi:GerAB/ArcD/ProY family transporter [Paenibacillus riograndensis]|uniref:Spore germination protein n=1 Tax=Paenibacillus riograndensis SBR5 TaxID=1073571 RepID=A0A0E4CWJ2_9BACL|nr:GerAB/ArcD/ProY family transporter [Paenibacillus riograndensis]CQR55330.1 spore germination protein [Paenibacillus riograndensis SBR5]
MGTVKIGMIQFFSITLLFELGTALVVNLGMAAGRDAWLSILIGSAGGIGVFAGYAYLYRKYPGMSFTAYTRKLLGKYIGTPVALVYIILYINLAARDLRDGSTMLAMATMHNTPLFILSMLMILSSAYVLHKGFEVLTRTSLVFLLLVLLIGIFSTLMLMFSGSINLNRLLPVLEDGAEPVIRSVLHQNYMFPFGEMIAFTMLMPFLSNVKKGPWVIAGAMLVSALMLSFTMALNISVLGADIVERSPLPLMPTISKISISDFIQRVDIFVVMVLIIGVFFKISVFFAAALIGISDLFGIPYRRMLYPCTLIILFTSMLDARSFTEHLDEGGRLLYTVYPFLMIAIPAVLILVSVVKSYFSASRPG